MCPNVFNDICKTLGIFINIKYPINNFLKFIEENRNLSAKSVSNFYLRIIKDKELNKNEELNKIIIQFLIQKNIMNDINIISSLIEIISSSDKNLLILF